MFQPQRRKLMAQNRGNFANDRERASQAGQKGGQASHGGSEDRQRTQSGGKTGQQMGGQHSGGNFANDRERASEAGRKGGEHSGGGNR
jgi:general stress protein YciG